MKEKNKHVKATFFRFSDFSLRIKCVRSFIKFTTDSVSINLIFCFSLPLSEIRVSSILIFMITRAGAQAFSKRGGYFVSFQDGLSTAVGALKPPMKL